MSDLRVIDKNTLIRDVINFLGTKEGEEYLSIEDVAKLVSITGIYLTRRINREDDTLEVY